MLSCGILLKKGLSSNEDWDGNEDVIFVYIVKTLRLN